jgi:drug/metabolite transporter (DMT)-like permease
MEGRIWMLFVALAGLCWGTYVPLIAQGGKELRNSYASFLCVGVAYFLIAILFPIGIMVYRNNWPQWKATGVTLATLAGVAGALGALCVIFATFEFGGDRKYVAPVIFALAPIINTLVSMVWQPEESTLTFGLPRQMPHWTLYVGIVLAGLGAGLVLYSKEVGEVKHAKAKTPPAAVASPEPAPMAHPELNQ